MNLPDDLHRLPSQALDVIRHLGTQQDGGAWLDDMMTDMGMSERGLRKWLRRLVTRYYAEMPIDGYYMLTTGGQRAAATLRDYDAAHPGEVRVASPVVDLDDADEFPVTVLPRETAPAELPEVLAPSAPITPVPAPMTPVPAPQAAPAAPRHRRRLMVVAPKELVARQPFTLKVGFDAPGSDQPALAKSARAILRLSAPGCDVRPTERPLDVAPDAVAGPVKFEITPRLPGSVHVKIEVFQLVTLRELVPVGGLYFDLNITDAPTSASHSLQALGAGLGLRVSPA